MAIDLVNNLTTIIDSFLVRGRNDGVAPAAGFIGEKLREAASAAIVLNPSNVNSGFTTLVSLTLPKGTWLVNAHLGTSVTANNSSIYHGLVGGTFNEYMAYASGETGRRRTSFTDVVTSTGALVISCRVQCGGTSVSGVGLDLSGEESYIVAVRVA